jgi:RNA polymerase sigma-70 factor (ECF subfamily)
VTKAKDKGWVDDALERYESRLLRYASALLGKSVAEDVVQDTFLRLCAQERAELEGHLGAWLFTVCRNRALDLARRQKPGADPDLVLSVPALQERGVEQREALASVLDVLDELSARNREVVLLKFAGDLSYKEIAEVLGLTPSNVGVILHEALHGVRKRLRQRGFFDECKKDDEEGSDPERNEAKQLRRVQ